MGPWSRSFIAAVAGNVERSELEVAGLRIDPGTIWGVVDGCEVTISAAVIPTRIWAAMTRYAQGMGQLEDAVRGKLQSVHLEHLLEEDWDESLVPRSRSIKQSCDCDGDEGCDHVAAVAFAFADEVEVAPRVLLRWRGVAASAEPEAEGDPWQGKELSEPAAARAMPAYAVLTRLGPAGMPVAMEIDLADVLRAAYDALVAVPGA